jgi:hypothetical protein
MPGSYDGALPEKVGRILQFTTEDTEDTETGGGNGCLLASASSVSSVANKPLANFFAGSGF